MVDFKKVILQKLKTLQLDLSDDDIMQMIEVPPEKELGDYAFPTFRFAKILRKAPNLIAEEFKDQLVSDDIIQEIRATGPYLNFFIRQEAFIDAIFEEGKKERFGAKNLGKGKQVIVEFSSTNIAKPFHIGHIRSTAIGNAIDNILRYEGYQTVRTNYIGDYGTQFGMMISAYLKWGDDERINNDPINELLNLYIRYNNEAKEDSILMDEARDWFDKLEKKDEKAMKLWSWFKEISLKEFERVYNLLGISFDTYDGEAFHSRFMGQVVGELEEKHLLEPSEGAMIVNLEEDKLPPVLIKKSNGSSTYITRDIATAKYRKRTYDFDQNLYVVASQQKLHFDQMRSVLKKMGYNWAEDCKHIMFGMISMKDGAMKTREGKIIFLEDVLKKAIEKTRSIMDHRDEDLPNKDEVAKQVGIGAIIFQDLFNNRIKDYVFDWDQVLNFEGETGPYTQYTYARSCSILGKGNFDENKVVNSELLTKEEERDLAKQLYQFKEVLVQAAGRYEPSLITRYTVELAKLFNRFYNRCPILSSEEDLKNSRLYLTFIVNKVLRIGLNLLGIEAPSRM